MDTNGRFYLSGMMSLLGLGAAMSIPMRDIIVTDTTGPTGVMKRRRSSRYTPHIGAKERARYAGWPDGPMHGVPYRLRSK